MKLIKFFIAALIMTSFVQLAKAQPVTETVYSYHYHPRIVIVHRPVIVERPFFYARPAYYHYYGPEVYYRHHYHYYRHCW